jgi:hypothetical protein
LKISQQHGSASTIIVEIYNCLARLEADQGHWSAAIDWLELSLAQAETMTSMAGLDRDLLVDLFDGCALTRLEARLKPDRVNAAPPARAPASADGVSLSPMARLKQRVENQGGLSALEAAAVRRTRERERFQNALRSYRNEYKAHSPRAGRLFKACLEFDHLDITGAIPFNDFWYYGNALRKADAVEAVWFYRAALHHARAPDGSIRENLKRDATAIEHALARFGDRATNRPDLDFPGLPAGPGGES